MQSSSAAALRAGALQLGVTVDENSAALLLRLLVELEQWNRAYSLTAITTREAMIAGHLLDSLAASADLVGARIADLGTGAGFPGLPLAIVHPGRAFTLIDGTAKKVRFVAHAARVLGLKNAEAVHARAEAMRPEQPFDTIVARAVASLPELAALARPLSGPGTRLLAYKGQRPPESELASIPPDWQLLAVRPLQVPGLEAERCLITLKYSPAAPLPAGAPAGLN